MAGARVPVGVRKGQLMVPSWGTVSWRQGAEGRGAPRGPREPTALLLPKAAH